MAESLSMWKALIWKELRETLGITALALAAFLALVASKIGVAMPIFNWRQAEFVPFLLPDTFIGEYLVVAVLFAAALGMRQTVGESARGTWLFLLHRPMDRRRILALKLAAGLGIYFLVGALPILAYALWAAAPGTHAGPFAWWMTTDAWAAWSLTGLVYLGAFLAGFRPGRWFGTRLLPLAGLSLLILLAGYLYYSYCRLWIGIGLGFLIAAAAVNWIFFVAQSREYS
jgi:ABC-type transport system involved in multi-copper enzyme maturation permease subunit